MSREIGLTTADYNSRLQAELSWRTRPGILGRCSSSQQSVHTLLGYFLSDRESPTPFPGRDVLVDQKLFKWGIAPPLEKVILSNRELDYLMGLPEIFRNSVAVIEPWENVGINLQGEAVRASKNIAYILQQIADADTILFPIWQSGVHKPRQLAQVMSSGIATIIEGGDPSVHNPASFDGTAAGLEDILSLAEELLMCRSPSSGPSIFICLGHQIAAAAQIRLIKRATEEIDNLARLPLDNEEQGIRSLRKISTKIAAVGETLEVIKQGRAIARGWSDPCFAVARNEQIEIGTRKLVPYKRRGDSSRHIPGDLHATHALIADELDGVIDTMLKTERDLKIEMFHSDEVNEEAALFANWAFKILHDTLIPIRHSIAVSPLSWLLCLPYAVEILSQTEVDESTWTEVSTTCIYYKDWETHSIRRSFTCQFHPELMADIRDIGGREAPRYAELKDNDGVRMLARLLYHGMQD